MRSLPATALVLLALAQCGCRERETDPALEAPDPASLQGDDWDRRAARVVDRARGTGLHALVTQPGTEREVVEILRRHTPRDDAERDRLRASASLLLRRPRATYAVAADAMWSGDRAARWWGLGAFEVVEGQRQPWPSSDAPGPPFRGPERDAALAAVARMLTSDPDPDLRHRTVRMALRLLREEEQPSPEELAAAFAQETQYEPRVRLFWLMGERHVPAALLLDAARHGFRDPVDVAVGIHDVFVEENGALIESALATGDAMCRAGIGESFYRHQSPMPWARDLILRGLVDPHAKVRANFAKGTLVLRPVDAEVRARLEALVDQAYEARWALAIHDGREPEPPPDGYGEE